MTDGREEDRFEDLSVGERLAERDRTHPEPVRRPEVPRPGNKYAWAVGIVLLMGLGILLFAETLPNQGKGLKGPEPGQRLPAFAAPAAAGDKEGDANVCQKEPCNKNAGTDSGLPAPGPRHRDRVPERARRARDDLRRDPRHGLRAAGGPG